MAALLLSGCAAETIEVSTGFFGGVAVDEPRAALIARDTIVSGGSAADAAVATFFTLAATLPSSAGLAAGGSCVVFDPASRRFERLDFPARPSSAGAAAVALPVAPRAMFALHARYGRARLEELIGVAETIARFGEPVSKRLAQDIAASLPPPRGRTEDEMPYRRPDGRPLAQGEPLQQVDLAATLGRIRVAGIGDLYTGQLARQFIDAAASVGYVVEPERLRDALPVWEQATGAPHQFHLWSVAAPTAVERDIETLALSLVLNGRGWNGLDEAARPAWLAEALSRAAAAVAAGQPDAGPDGVRAAVAGPDLTRPEAATPLAASFTGTGIEPKAGATSFIIVDRRGQSVGCAFGLNAPFGLGVQAPDTGILLAPPRPAAGMGPGAFVLVVGNTNTWQMQYAAQSSGGRGAASALLLAALRQWEEKRGPDAAVAATRFHPAIGAGRLLGEPGVALPPAMAAGGWALEPVPAVGRATLMRCLEGIPIGKPECEMGSDARGAGLTLFERSKF